MFSKESLYTFKGGFAGASLFSALHNDIFLATIFFLLWLGLECYTKEAFHVRRN